MKSIYRKQLFEKNILVATKETTDENCVEVLFSLAALFNIRIIKGEKQAECEMISFVSNQLGINVPKPFYRNFPDSARELSSDRLLFDQLFHYTKTYGLGLFDEAGHSLFENVIERAAFKENTEIRDYVIVSEREAVLLLEEIVNNLLQSSRPLSDDQYELVLESISDFNFDITECASKNTSVKLLADTRNVKFAKLIKMSDVIKLVDDINYRFYQNENIRKLNLKNQDRKFITSVINELFDSHRCDIKTCSEKKALWCGLLHHIHYKPFDSVSTEFVNIMRGKINISVFSDFEKALTRKDIGEAVTVLKEGKSAATVLRNLDYILSRCSNGEEVDFVLKSIETDNVIVLIQLLLKYSYSFSNNTSRRTFKFSVHNKLRVHSETDDEIIKRRSVISPKLANEASKAIYNNLQKALSGRLEKVYIDPKMKNIALPLQENTSQGGVGVLSKGSRIKINEGKKIRAFTYWEKVNDIDLSVIGMDEKGNQTEFSWRTMRNNQSDALTYSGDQTSGYYGGSEYFDIDIEKFKSLYPNIKYLILCDNVFSGINFDKCYCKAGYMIRDIIDSGEVFEPKTVESSFLVNCESTFAYLFGIDLYNNEFVWLNAVRDSGARVAGATSLSFLLPYFEITSIINMYSFFEMMASSIVDDPLEADVIVSDDNCDCSNGAVIIKSNDFDKVLKLMN